MPSLVTNILLAHKVIVINSPKICGLPGSTLIPENLVSGVDLSTFLSAAMHRRISVGVAAEKWEGFILVDLIY